MLTFTVQNLTCNYMYKLASLAKNQLVGYICHGWDLLLWSFFGYSQVTSIGHFTMIYGHLPYNTWVEIACFNSLRICCVSICLLIMCFTLILQDLVVILLTVFGYLYAGVFMTIHTLSWSRLAGVEADVGSVDTAAEATTVSAVSVGAG